MKKALFTMAVLLCALVVYGDECVRVMSYNVENFFDIQKDSVKNDASFTPEGDHAWNRSRYKKKVVNIARVIAAVGGWKGAAIVGLYEVENDYVLNSLTKFSPLEKRGYKFVHYESSDPRGIDVAMLYDPTRIKVLKSRPLRSVCKGEAFPTRDILYVKALVLNTDTLHLFMCHAPSRRGGVEASSWKRECVMSTVRHMTDSINASGRANIIVMGDFNDTPENKSVRVSLGAGPLETPVKTTRLYNMFWKYHKEEDGTYKYGGEWSVLDQIIVSGSLLKKGGLHTSQDNAKIYDADFILEDDIKNYGRKPWRTFNGRKYLGGYSDHLPIYIDLFLKTEK